MSRARTHTRTHTTPRLADLPELMTVGEFRAYLRISRNAAYDLVKTGVVPSVKFGRLIRIPKDALLNGSKITQK